MATFHRIDFVPGGRAVVVSLIDLRLPVEVTIDVARALSTTAAFRLRAAEPWLLSPIHGVTPVLATAGQARCNSAQLLGTLPDADFERFVTLPV